MARNVATTSPADTIVAPATGAGAAAIAIVRLSGPEAAAIAATLFSRPQPTPAMMVLGRLADDGREIDHCLAVRWQAPNSYTGEDMVEFHLHGSPAIVAAAVAACTRAGARPAHPGEFTRRAFLNGKLNLAQAEAVAALAAAQTEAGRAAALAQLTGGVAKQIGAARVPLLEVIAELEARIDFPEEMHAESRRSLRGKLDAPLASLKELRSSGRRGELLRDGARVVLCGRPNAGKSSLFNALLRRERAIVSPHPGTTRDTLEATVDLGGVPVTFVDTAGIRDDAGEIEALGIERAREAIESADLAVHVVDASEAGVEAPEQGVRGLAVAHKIDLLASAERAALMARHAHWVPVSSLTGEGLGNLEAALLSMLGGAAAPESKILPSKRQAAAVDKACMLVGDAWHALEHGMAPELIVQDLQLAVSLLDEVLGIGALDEEVLDLIFSKFCIGK